jgi:hypothetical protein
MGVTQQNRLAASLEREEMLRNQVEELGGHAAAKASA